MDVNCPWCSDPWADHINPYPGDVKQCKCGCLWPDPNIPKVAVQEPMSELAQKLKDCHDAALDTMDEEFTDRELFEAMAEWWEEHGEWND